MKPLHACLTALALMLGSSQAALANLNGEEVSFQRVFEGVVRAEIGEQGTFIVGPGVDFTSSSDTYTVDASANLIRLECIRALGCGFGDSPPHEFQFFLPFTILDASLTSENFAGISQSNVGTTRNKLSIDINNLSPIPQGGFFEVSLNLGASTKAVPIWSPWSLTIMVLGMLAILGWYRRRSFGQS